MIGDLLFFFARFGRNMGEMSIEGGCYRRINVDRLKFSYLLESTVITTTVFTTVYTGTGRWATSRVPVATN